MDGLIALFYKITLKMQQFTLIRSIRQGFVLTIPIFMAGATSLLLQSFPFEPVRLFVANFMGGALYSFLGLVFTGTFGMASLYILLAITYKYSSNITGEPGMLNIMACFTSIASYMALLGTMPLANVGDEQVAIVIYRYLNVQSVFCALLTATLSTRLFLWLVKTLPILPGVRKIDSDVDFKTALLSVIPMFITVGLFALTAVAIGAAFENRNLNDLIVVMLVSPFLNMGRSLGSATLATLTQSLLWFCGIHGSNTLESVNLLIFNDVSGKLFTKTFFDVFVLMGGCGTSLCLAIAFKLFSRSRSGRILFNGALLPMLFNINEIVIFGLPIVLNPVMLIPFIITPLVSLLIASAVISAGLVPLPSMSVTWTTPAILSGYLATGSFSGSLLQILIMTVGVFIYRPFVKMSDKIRVLQRHKLIEEMVECVKQTEAGSPAPRLFERGDYLEKAARELALEFRDALAEKSIKLYYQPQVDVHGRVISAEALLRWNYMDSGCLYPPLVVEIAKSDGTFDQLTDYIIDYAINDISRLNMKFGTDISVSINIQCYQLNDPKFIADMIRRVKEGGLMSNTFGIEITEESALTDGGSLQDVFSELRRCKIDISIDDFSMGHTSLKYLQDCKFDFIKLDGGLVRSLLENDRCRDIIQSIIMLGRSLDFRVVAEYVETEEQRAMLEYMGCSVYQGYLYSPALPLDGFIEYVEKTNGAE